MKKAKLIGLAVSLFLVVALMLPAVAYVAAPENPGRPDKERPVSATDVELVKKATLKGPTGGKGKGSKVGAAATGSLGVPVAGDRFAVVVGISDYPDDANDLDYCDDDAEDMNNALITSYGFNPANIALLKDLDATRFNIISAIENVPSSAGEVVFFFSGHGTKGKADDGDLEQIDEAIAAHNGSSIVPIWDGELKGAFSKFSASTRLVLVFDTCLAGGMKSDLAAAGRIIAMATTENTLAVESPALQNGEFSYYFVDQGMIQGIANTHDYDDDDLLGEATQVTAEEAFDYSKANCSYDKPTIGDYFDNDLLL